MNGVENAFLQYGALGAVALLALLAVRAMYNRLQTMYDREKERADRLETELKELNALVRTEYIETISAATRAIADALAVVRRSGG